MLKNGERYKKGNALILQEVFSGKESRSSQKKNITMNEEKDKTDGLRIQFF